MKRTTRWECGRAHVDLVRIRILPAPASRRGRSEGPTPERPLAPMTAAAEWEGGDRLPSEARAFSSAKVRRSRGFPHRPHAQCPGVRRGSVCPVGHGRADDAGTAAGVESGPKDAGTRDTACPEGWRTGRPLRVVPRALPGGREGCEDGPGTTTSGEDALRVWRSLPFVNSPEVRARCPDPAFVRSNA